MALIVVFQNITNLSEISDYKVDVYVNNKKIDGDMVVKGHIRSDGYKKLVKKFIEQYEL